MQSTASRLLEGCQGGSGCCRVRSVEGATEYITWCAWRQSCSCMPRRMSMRNQSPPLTPPIQTNQPQAGIVDVEVPAPWLVLDCPGVNTEHFAEATPQQQQAAAAADEKGTDSAQQQREKAGGWLALQPPVNVQQQQQQLVWSIPAGNLDHSEAVALITTGVLIACSAAVVRGALQAMRRSDQRSKAA